MNYEFHPAAEEEFLDSVGFYESRVGGLGGALIDEFLSLANTISHSPTTWKIVAVPNIRIAYFRRFPLSLIYRESTERVLRASRFWQWRIKVDVRDIG